MSEVALDELVSACIDVAEHSGAIIRDVYASGCLDVVEKAGGIVSGIDGKTPDPQTVADRRAESLIVSSLKAVYPALQVIGEEGCEGLSIDGKEAIAPDLTRTKQHWKEPAPRYPVEKVTVWVDPLDGTAEYTYGNVVAVTTLIGICIDGVACAGVIAQPFYAEGNEAPCGRVVWGERHIGAFGYTRQPSQRDYCIVGTSRKRRHPRTDPGKTDVWLSLCDATKKWDICAPDALLAASGGRLSDAAGRPYRYTVDAALPNAAGLVGLADAAKHAEVIAAIAPAIAPYPYDVAP